MPRYRTLYLTKNTVMVDGRSWERTSNGAPSTLPELLTQISKNGDPAGTTVILGNGAHIEIGFPERLPRRESKDHPALEAARMIGWNVADISPWMTFWQSGVPSIHIGIRPWLRGGKDANFELHDDDPIVEQSRLWRFHDYLGTPYHGKNSGLPGIDLLRDHQKGKSPLWTPGNWDRIAPAAQTVEVVTDKWRTELPAHGKPFEHSYDAALQFLSAAINAKVAVGKLQWTHPDQLSLDSPSSVMPGYYRVTVPSWVYRDRIPHPLGDRHEYGRDVWVTGATLELALELDRDGVMVAPDVHEAWVSPGGQVLKGWAQKIRDAEHVARLSGDTVLHTSVKKVYKAALGLMARQGQARVYRPDWQQTVVGLARSNLWRKMWREGNTSDRWPVEIHADAVWYAGDHQAPDWPVTFRQGAGPGCFRHEATRVAA